MLSTWANWCGVSALAKVTSSGNPAPPVWREVEHGGRVWRYRLPRPHAAFWLGTLGRNVAADERIDALVQYLEHVLHPADFDALMELAFDARHPFDLDEVGGLLAAVTEGGSARPYHVDTSLAGAAVENWTAIRGRLVTGGVPDPLRQLPTMYALLDAVEAMVLESHQDERERDRYWRRMYAPPPGTRETGRLPRGWDRDSELAGFDALL